MTSYFDQLQTGGVHPLYAVLEVWLRRLRDLGGADLQRLFSADPKRCVIRIHDPFMDWDGREKLITCLQPILVEHEYLGLQRLTESILEYPPFKRGCDVEFKIAEPSALKQLHIKPHDSHRPFKMLWDYANAVGRQFYLRRSCLWSIFPRTYLPAVWLKLKPAPGRIYPTLGKGFSGHVSQEYQLIARRCPNPHFELSSLAEEGGVWLLLDLKTQKDSSE